MKIKLWDDTEVRISSMYKYIENCILAWILITEHDAEHHWICRVTLWSLKTLKIAGNWCWIWRGRFIYKANVLCCLYVVNINSIWLMRNTLIIPRASTSRMTGSRFFHHTVGRPCAKCHNLVHMYIVQTKKKCKHVWKY